ncbi:hypothetical protein [Dokdonella sp.]|uniref:hypothetical protein n=1 Tax=Dokdonella sp. TaxID=2291710 RepID=UPI003529CC6A
MKLSALLLLASIGTAFAQERTDYNLNEGRVNFSVPSGWSAIMEKSDGNPQAIIFWVPDPATEGTDDTASVTVKTRRLNSPNDFAEATQNELALSKAQTGYEAEPEGNNANVHRYFVTRGKTRYTIRDRFTMLGNVAVQVRCQRPILDGTTQDWIARFDAGCNSVASSVK